MYTDANNMKKRSRDSNSPNKDKKYRECGTDPNTSDVKLTTFEDFIEKEDILHYLAHKFTSNPLKLLIGMLPKVSKRCGAAAEQALAILVEVVIEPYLPFRNVTDKIGRDREVPIISAVIGRCPNIKKLSIEARKIDAKGVKLLLEALKTNSVLQTLQCATARPFFIVNSR